MLGKLIDESPGLELFEKPEGRAAWVGFLAKLDAIDRDLAELAN